MGNTKSHQNKLNYQHPNNTELPPPYTEMENKKPSDSSKYSAQIANLTEKPVTRASLKEAVIAREIQKEAEKLEFKKTQQAKYEEYFNICCNNLVRTINQFLKETELGDSFINLQIQCGYLGTTKDTYKYRNVEMSKLYNEKIFDFVCEMYKEFRIEREQNKDSIKAFNDFGIIYFTVYR
jgi:hypothetical protein